MLAKLLCYMPIPEIWRWLYQKWEFLRTLCLGNLTSTTTGHMTKFCYKNLNELHIWISIFKPDFLNNLVQNWRILKSNSNGSQKLSSLKVAKEINKQGKFAVVASYNEENCTIPLENVDVHTILLDSQKSINYMMSCFKHRKRNNREPWMLQFQVKSKIIQ